jgi:Uma2 family endonuclease
MPQPLPRPVHLLDDLALEDRSQVRHGYLGGYTYGKASGTLRHNRISGNLARILSNLLEGGPCQVFINGMKHHVQAADNVYYPDVFVYRGSAIANDE